MNCSDFCVYISKFKQICHVTLKSTRYNPFDRKRTIFDTKSSTLRIQTFSYPSLHYIHFISTLFLILLAHFVKLHPVQSLSRRRTTFASKQVQNGAEQCRTLHNSTIKYRIVGKQTISTAKWNLLAPLKGLVTEERLRLLRISLILKEWKIFFLH